MPSAGLPNAQPAVATGLRCLQSLAPLHRPRVLHRLCCMASNNNSNGKDSSAAIFQGRTAAELAAWLVCT